MSSPIKRRMEGKQDLVWQDARYLRALSLIPNKNSCSVTSHRSAFSFLPQARSSQEKGHFSKSPSGSKEAQNSSKIKLSLSLSKQNSKTLELLSLLSSSASPIHPWRTSHHRRRNSLRRRRRHRWGAR